MDIRNTKDLALALRLFRERSGLTQAEIAEAAQLRGKQSISAYEADGKLSTDRLLLILERLGCKLVVQPVEAEVAGLSDDDAPAGNLASEVSALRETIRQIRLERGDLEDRLLRLEDALAVTKAAMAESLTSLGDSSEAQHSAVQAEIAALSRKVERRN